MPFLPPLAILMDSSNSFRSLITRPVFRSFTSVPLGILMIKSFPSLPFLLLFFPFPPSSAMNFTFDVMSSSVSTFSFTCRMTLPPLPPFPPLGPPRGTYFSQRKLTPPSPPLPPFTKIVTSSINIAGIYEKRERLSSLLLTINILCYNRKKFLYRMNTDPATRLKCNFSIYLCE